MPNKLLCGGMTCVCACVCAFVCVYVCGLCVCLRARVLGTVCVCVWACLLRSCACANMESCRPSRRKKNQSGRSWKKSWRRITARSPRLRPNWYGHRHSFFFCCFFFVTASVYCVFCLTDKLFNCIKYWNIINIEYCLCGKLMTRF